MSENYKKGIETLIELHKISWQDYADKYRKDVLIPLCKKHRLTFAHGMGLYGFTSLGKKVTITSIDDAKENKMEYLIPIFQILDMEISYNHLFGCYVQEIY